MKSFRLYELAGVLRLNECPGNGITAQTIINNVKILRNKSIMYEYRELTRRRLCR